MESGFNYQSFEGECGTFTLIHTLLLLGVAITLDEAFEALNQSKTKTRMFGTDAKKIIHALQKYGCQALVYDIDDEDKAKRKIDEALENHYPVILSVEGGEHWAVLAGRNHNGYIYIDSGEGELFGECPWKDVSQWLRYEADKDSESCYYFIVVKNNPEHSITAKAGELLKLYEQDETLLNFWGFYLSDMCAIFDSPQDQKNSTSVSAKDFFHKYRDMILQAATENYLYSDDECISYELCNYEKVARMHSLSVSKENETEAAINMAAILTLLAVGIE